MSVFVPPDTGSLEQDLVAFLRRGMEVLTTLERAGLAWPLIAESVRSADLAEPVLTDLFSGDYAALAVIVERAVQRGEIAAGNDDVELIFHTLAGYLAFRRYILHHSMDDSKVQEICGILARGLGQPRHVSVWSSPASSATMPP